LSEAKGKHLLILNSDTRVLENSLSAMSGYLDRHPEAGGVTCRMQYPDGRFYVNGMGDYSFLLALVNCTVLGVLLPGLKKKLNAELGYQGEDWARDREVAVVGDCNLMIRRDVFEKVGLYDETMKLYYTENDYCVRIREKGFKIGYLADGKVVHHLRGTVSKSGLQKISKIYEEDTLAYFRKYSGAGAVLLLKVLIGLTNLLLTLRHGSPQNIFAKFLTPGKGDAKS
jgi:GT2 family glycosyltransferase